MLSLLYVSDGSCVIGLQTVEYVHPKNMSAISIIKTFIFHQFQDHLCIFKQKRASQYTDRIVIFTTVFLAI